MRAAFPLCAFLAGAGVMAVEMLGSRWLAPLFGFTLTTWSALIAATLTAGSLGAWLGGRLSPTATWRSVGLLFVATGSWIGIVAALFPPLGSSLARLSPMTGLGLATAILVGPPVVAAGMVFPVLVHLRQTGGAAVGPIVGSLAAFSTLGSLAGTLVPGLWLLPQAGVRTTAFGVGGVVCTAGCLLLFGSWRWRATGGAVVLALASIGVAASRPETTEHSTTVESPYGLLTLDHGPAGAALRVNGIIQSRFVPAMIDKGYLLAHRNHFELLPYLRPGRWRTLHVGLGAGLVPRCLARHGLVCDSIEVNAVLADLVRRRLGYDGRVIVGDGRRVIRELEDRYDFVILDVFQGESPAAHLMTVEAFGEIRERLEPDGVLCVHLIGAPRTDVTASVARTLKAVFPELMGTRSGLGNELQDVYLFASRHALAVPHHPELERAGYLGNEAFIPEPERGVIVTDDRNPLEILNEPLARAFRRAQ